MTSQSKIQSNTEGPKLETEDQEYEYARKIKKPDYYPPGYLITHFDKSLVLDEERAQKFADFRTRLCDALGQSDERCNVKNLLMRAIDLLMENEAAILADIEKL